MIQHDDASEAELAYLQERVNEIEAEQRVRLRELGDALGVEIGPEDMTPKIAQAFADKIVAELRRYGNGSLASRWSVAFIEFEAAGDAFKQLVDHLARGYVGAPTAEQRREWDEIRDGANAAQEQFERVESEAIAFLKRMAEREGD